MEQREKTARKKQEDVFRASRKSRPERDNADS